MRCFVLLVLACALAGCLTPNTMQATRIHTLDPKIQVKTFPLTAATIGVRPLQAARPYKTVMAYVDENSQLHYFVDETWAEPPDKYLTRTLTDALGATGHFADAGYAADMSRPDLIVTGELRKFHENRALTPPVAEIEVRLELREARQTRNLWSEILVSRVPVTDETPAALGQSMNQAVAEIATRAAEAIAQATP